MGMEEHSVKHLVADTGPFIRNAPIGTVGAVIYSLRDVLSEIRDKTTRQRLQVLPYDVCFKEPTTEAIRAVTDFSKKTGDYRSLSAVDLRVMALAYQLEKEFVGTEHLKTTPDRNVKWTVSKRHLENPTEIAGFYLAKSCSKKDDTSATTDSCSDTMDTSTHTDTQTESLILTPEQTPTETKATDNQMIEHQVASEGEPLSSAPVTNPTDKEMPCVNDSSSKDQLNLHIQQGDTITSEQLEADSEEDEDDSDEEEDDGEGWITPSNLQAVRRAMGDKNVNPACVTVGCMTTDFAMQNVLIQMGLNVVSVDGMLIKRAKNYVLRCSGCAKVTTNLQKEFCFHCGNRTLQKVSMTVEDDGSIRYFLSKRRPMSRRGLKYSLPKPQGGKHAVNPRLVEDQGLPHQRMANKSKIKYDVLDADYIANSSPFAPTDTTSRAALLGIRNHRHNFRSKRNPNENKKVYGRRK